MPPKLADVRRLGEDVPGDQSDIVDPRVREIQAQLRLIGPGPAEFFRSAARMVSLDPRLGATTHLVAHALRECESSLRAVARPMVAKERQAEIEAMEAGGHQAWIEAVCTALGFDADDEVRKAWRQTFAGRQHRWTHREALAAPRPVDAEFERWWADAVDVLGAVARQFQSVYLETRGLIDELAALDHPTREDAMRLANEVPQSVVALDRFFSAATSPAWLPLLRKRGYFNSAPEIETDEDGNPFFSAWPPGKLLQRLASDDQARPAVIEIALALETENPDAQAAIADAALRMPAADAARLVPKLGGWLNSPYRWVLPIRLQELMRHLAAHGETAAALDLFRALTESELARDPDFTADLVRDAALVLFPDAGVDGIAVLSDLLSRVAADDHMSAYSRPSLDEDRRRGLPDALVTSLREASGSVLGAGAGANAVFGALGVHPGTIFRRLELDLLRNVPAGNEQRIAAALADRDLLREPDVRREHSLLTRERFSQLAPEQRAAVLAAIEAGPVRPEGLSDESWEERRERWQLERLADLGEELPPDWSARRRQLTDRYGEPPDRTRPLIEGAIWSGPVSPRSRDELRALAPDELLDYLRTWQAPAEWRGPSVEGLAREIEPLVIETPQPWAERAAAFADFDPTYARTLLSGLERALATGTDWPWGPVLGLSRLALEKPRLFEGRSTEDIGDPDPGWIWVRREIAHLLAHGLGKDAIGPELSDSAWEVLSELAEDPEPDARFEERYGGSNMEPAMLALNSNRGAAIRAVLEFALWQHRQREREGVERHMLSEPVRELLERHLDPAVDSSLAIRALYGEYFPRLLLLDDAWARNHVTAIFPPDPDEAELWAAAWEAYVQANGAYTTPLDVLKDEYRRAVEAVTADDRITEQDLPARDRALASHLITHYWHGRLDLNRAGLLDRFYELANIALRQHVIQFIGISLIHMRDDGEDLRSNTAERLRHLWARRFDALRADPDGLRSELAPFAWWFGSGQLDIEWSLDQLQALLEAGGQIHPDHLVAERLAQLPDEQLERATQLLELAIHTGTRRWFVLGARESIRTLLRRALATGDGSPSARAARALANRLAAGGHPEFIDLLGQD